MGLFLCLEVLNFKESLKKENSNIEKEYIVRVTYTGSERSLPPDKLKLLNFGLSIDGEKLKPALVEWINEDQLRFILKEGKKRQIRKMCEVVGLQVNGLKRVRVGKLSLGKIPEGQWRFLEDNEEI